MPADPLFVNAVLSQVRALDKKEPRMLGSTYCALHRVGVHGVTRTAIMLSLSGS